MTMTAASKSAGGDEAEREPFALPLDHREQRDGRADAGQGGDQVEEGPRITWVSEPALTM